MKSLLIMDDDKSNLEILLSIFNAEYKIYMTKSGVAAIDIAKKYLPDAMLLDIIMPDINGYDVLTELKKTPETKDIPVLFISGLDSPEDEKRGLELGAAGFVHKPFVAKDVKERVQKILNIGG